jgi:tripartite-type tricarboxylate transporter receptor subunit TctC
MIKTFMLRKLLGLAVLPVTLCCTSVWAAEEYPVRPVRIITVFPTGAGPDTVLRLVADKLTRSLGKQVIVENRPGGNGFIALFAAKTATPDGYTLAYASGSQLTTHTLVYSKLPYNPVKDFQPVTPLFRNSFFIVVSANSVHKSVGDIIAAAKAKPGVVSYGSEFVGSPGHLGALTLASAAGVQMTHVPFKETSQLFNAVANNDVAWAFGSAATAGALQAAGRVRYLAIGMPARLPAYPDVPTVPQSNGPAGYTLDAWTAVIAPTGVPAAIITQLNKAINAAMQEPDIRSRLVVFGYEAFPMTPADTAKLIDNDTRRYEKIIREANLKFD